MNVAHPKKGKNRLDGLRDVLLGRFEHFKGVVTLVCALTCYTMLPPCLITSMEIFEKGSKKGFKGFGLIRAVFSSVMVTYNFELRT